MAWIPLSTDRFKDKLLKSEYDALVAVGLFDGRTWAEVLADELLATTRNVRGYCPPSTARGDGDTIPDELEDQALAIARMKFFTRFVELKKLWSDARNQEYLQALELLKLWATNKYHVAPAATEAPDEEQSAGGGVQLVSSRTINTTQTGLDGLM